MRVTWSGTLSFGLVSVPVGLAVSQDRDTVGFRQVHKGCGERIRLIKTCPTHGQLDASEVVKGYEYGDGEFLQVEESEIAETRPDASRTILIQQFVPLEQIQPGVLDRTYFLVPSKEAREREGYALLVEAMKRTKTAAVASFVLWGRDNLCAVRAQDGRLMLDTLYRPEDLRSPVPVDDMLGDVKVAEDAVKLAVQLVKSELSDFNHAAHRSTFNDELRARMDARIAGKPAKKAAAKPAQKKPSELLDALKASLAASGSAASKPKRRTKTKA